MVVRRKSTQFIAIMLKIKKESVLLSNPEVLCTPTVRTLQNFRPRHSIVKQQNNQIQYPKNKLTLTF
jgi:hypothetical protein